MRSSPSARIAKARNFPNRLRLKSERCSQESSGGKTFRRGMTRSRMPPTTQKARPPPRFVSATPSLIIVFSLLPKSLLGTAPFCLVPVTSEERDRHRRRRRSQSPTSIGAPPLHRKQSRRLPLQEQNHQHEDEDLAVHGAKAPYD